MKDFRRTTAKYVNGVRVAEENVLPEDEFVLFDLGADSLLEPITDEKDDFRVTCYDPRLMAKTHGTRSTSLSRRSRSDDGRRGHQSAETEDAQKSGHHLRTEKSDRH